ncbi:MAG: LLM class flavin-dependent oxidoreductase [Euzebyales bacterium]|nr:LLM class flavin-dependent oxidoreductase [Euzebyales bacterium]
MRHGLFVAPFGELSEPAVVAECAAEAEQAGFHGLFVWDHVLYAPHVEEIADPWVTLAAVACATRSLRLGTMVTPVGRRRPHKLARETVTLDRLSGGRVVLGVGLGSDTTGELDTFGEPSDARERARLLDTGLGALVGYWAGDEVGDTGVRFLPRPVQLPRIPVWVASVYPHRTPLQRVAQWDGWFPIGLDDPAQLAEQLAVVRDLRGGDIAGFDVVVRAEPDHHPTAWADAGATWWLSGFGPTPTVHALRTAIADGPVG